MPKFKKELTKASKSKKSSENKRNLILRTIRTSAILSGIFLTLSLFFNMEIITYFMNRGIYWDIVDVALKVSLILFSFLFIIISVSNYKELTGKPIKLDMVLLFVGLSLGQTVKNLYVFIFTLVGLILLLIYLYMIQES